MDNPFGDPHCEDDRQRCICMTKRTALKTKGILINPKSKEHVLYCIGHGILCTTAWVAVFMPDHAPLLSKWKAGIVALCYNGSNLLEKYEQTSKGEVDG